MLNVTKESKGGVLVIKLSGSIEESVNFDQLLGEAQPQMHVYCRDVKRINSIGVKAWIRYFQIAQKKGSNIKLFECSTAIVEQINLISNFTCGGTVESLFIPFCCNQCKTELVGLFKSEDLKKLNLKVPDFKCAKCGGKAAFDDIPEEYLGFLTR